MSPTRTDWPLRIDSRLTLPSKSAAMTPSPLRAQSASAPASAAAGGHRIAERGGEGTLARRATQADADAALRALNQLLDAYQTGDLAGFDALLANTLPGRQRLVEGFMRGLAEQRNTRVHLFDVQVTAGPDVAAIQAGWEKRSLASAGFTPQLAAPDARHVDPRLAREQT